MSKTINETHPDLRYVSLIAQGKIAIGKSLFFWYESFWHSKGAELNSMQISATSVPTTTVLQKTILNFYFCGTWEEMLGTIIWELLCFCWHEVLHYTRMKSTKVRSMFLFSWLSEMEVHTKWVIKHFWKLLNFAAAKRVIQMLPDYFLMKWLFFNYCLWLL